MTPPFTTGSMHTCPGGTYRSSTRPISPTTSALLAISSPSVGRSFAGTSRLDAIQGRLEWGAQLSGRDRKAVNNTVNGLLKLLWPNPDVEIPDDALAWAAELAVELRRRVKEQQAAIGVAEFGGTDLSYRVGDRPEKVVYCDESVQHRLRAQDEGGRSITGERSESEVLPEPDPAEVKSSVGAKAMDYSIGDVIDGRFEILDLLGQGGFSKVYRVRDEVEGEERAFKLFENAGWLRSRSSRNWRSSKDPPSQRGPGLLGRQN